MKILRFDDDRIGVLKDGDKVVDVSDVISHRAERGPQRVMEVLIGEFSDYRGEIEKIVAAADGVPLDSVNLLAPEPRPSRCLAAFVNYLDRPDRSKDTLPNEFFHKAPELVGPGGTVELPDVEPIRVFHPEAELAYVIGKHAKNVAEKDAMDYVFGYVPFFDISARGLVRRSQLIPKGQDTFACAGPWITTADEVPDPHKLQVKSWVSGEARQDYSTEHMAHDIPDEIAWLSKFLQLQPGDIIATGTYHEGLGPVNSGDTIEIEIERLGRTSFNVGGDSPRKDFNWAVGGGRNDPPKLEPGLSISRV
jgi:2-keto-4-pentenoate hydratase/2-oxohepta-3-ene-1,7-dioic acid hydratase in catechol pathway